MEVVCAALAGICARVLCHPLDTIKTVSFTDLAGHTTTPHTASSSSSHFVTSAKQIWRGEGIPGFFRGVGVATLGAAPGVALYLGTYHKLRDQIQSLADEASDADRLAKEKSLFRQLAAPTCRWMPSSVIHFVSGLGAEAMSCLVWVPIDVSKERLQSQPPSVCNRYRNSYDALRTIVRKEGLGGLYKGYWSTLLSFGPFSAVYFVCYEYFTTLLQSTLAHRRETGVRTANDTPSFLVPLLAGAGGNIVASLVTNPLELVKTRMQVQRAVLNNNCDTARGDGCHRLYRYEYKGMIDGLRTIAKTEGWRMLWRGVGSRVAFTAPNAALTMMFYEYFLATLPTQTAPKA